MKEIRIVCDRCGKVVHGYIDEAGDPKMTGGFYDVTGDYWSQFARWEEEKVCDACMHACPKYRKAYSLPPLPK